MTGPDDPAFDETAFDDASFDDPAFDDVRAMLAEARATDPVPAPVAARLDETLASLQAEREEAGAGSGDPVVVPLRRRFAPMIAAAAAVVVVAAGGVAIARSAQDRSGGADSSASAGSADSRASSPAPGSTPLSGAKSSAPSAGSVPAPQAPALPGKAAVALPRLRSTAFAQDAARVMLSLAAGSAAGTKAAAPSEESLPGSIPNQDTNGSLQAPPVTASPGVDSPYDSRAVAACAGPVAQDAIVLPAQLDGAPVALVFRAPTATGQQVEAWSCDGTTLLARAAVPH